MAKLTHDQFIERMAAIKLVAFDVDGVLTDGLSFAADRPTQVRSGHRKMGEHKEGTIPCT